jgi:metallo-beta-lactamase family protein
VIPDTPTLTFLGGAGTVTGSKYLITAEGSQVLVDCGLFQGRKELRLRNWTPLEVDPACIDAVVLTHAHIDHCGYLPRMINHGFVGQVLCTRGTARLASIVLPDSGHLHEEEAAYANRKGYSKHHPALPLYTEADGRRSLEQLRPVAFGEPVTVAPGIEVTWRRAGHILGAASLLVHLTHSDRQIAFSGDLGRGDHPLLLPPDPIDRADVIVCETTYGDRDRPEEADGSGGVRALLADAVNETARRGGVVLIPAFAVDRTEVVLHHLDALVADGLVPDLPVYVDSPMASAALQVYRDEARAGSEEFRPEFHRRGLFESVRLNETRTVEESKQLNSLRGPLVIISASGMATGGRILHHLATRLGDDRNTVLLVGFQAPGTRGERLASGATTIKLLGAHRPVGARVRSLALSAHADRTQLASWLATASPPPEIVYLTHGEPAASAGFAEYLAATWMAPTITPSPGDRFSLGS